MKRTLCSLAVVLLIVAAGGCAITDYSGFVGHKTTGEAKLFGTEISFNAGPNDPLTGTYAYTVKYDNRGGQDTVTIYSYRNPVPSSFSNDGIVDRDGDDVQGNGGIAGGKFNNQWVAVDPTGGAVCEFSSNITFNKGNVSPIVSACFVTNEEIDKDFDLHAEFADLGALVGFVWENRGATSALELTAVEFDGVEAAVGSLSVGFASNGLRPIQLSVDGTGEAFDSFLQAVLAHTSDRQPVDLRLHFAGGLSLAPPAGWQFAFDHVQVQDLLAR